LPNIAKLDFSDFIELFPVELLKKEKLFFAKYILLPRKRDNTAKGMQNNILKYLKEWLSEDNNLRCVALRCVALRCSYYFNLFNHT